MRHFRPLCACLFLSFSLACGDGATPATPTSIETGVRTFVDSSRSTPSNADFAGVATRTLETRIWRSHPSRDTGPACDSGRCALVVLAHGFGGNTARFDGIARALAEAGYVVAAPRFPLTNEAAPGGHRSGLGDAVDQPGDLSFVVDELLRLSAENADELVAGIDPSRVGLVGHSLGGATAIAHTRTTCCADRRVDAVALVAPVAALVDALFQEPVLVDGPPTLVLSGAGDPVVPPEAPRDLYDAISAPRVHVLLEDADHVDLIENVGAPDPSLVETADLLVAFFDRFLSGQDTLPAALDRLDARGHLVRSELR